MGCVKSKFTSQAVQKPSIIKRNSAPGIAVVIAESVQNESELSSPQRDKKRKQFQMLTRRELTVIEEKPSEEQMKSEQEFGATKNRNSSLKGDFQISDKLALSMLYVIVESDENKKLSGGGDSSLRNAQLFTGSNSSQNFLPSTAKLENTSQIQKNSEEPQITRSEATKLRKPRGQAFDRDLIEAKRGQIHRILQIKKFENEILENAI